MKVSTSKSQWMPRKCDNCGQESFKSIIIGSKVVHICQSCWKELQLLLARHEYCFILPPYRIYFQSVVDMDYVVSLHNDPAYRMPISEFVELPQVVEVATTIEIDN